MPKQLAQLLPMHLHQIVHISQWEMPQPVLQHKRNCLCSRPQTPSFKAGCHTLRSSSSSGTDCWRASRNDPNMPPHQSHPTELCKHVRRCKPISHACHHSSSEEHRLDMSPCTRCRLTCHSEWPVSVQYLHWGPHKRDKHPDGSQCSGVLAQHHVSKTQQR